MTTAVVAPLFAEISIGFRVPVVLLEMFFGIIVSSHGANCDVTLTIP
jgi:hypothetical protein